MTETAPRIWIGHCIVMDCKLTVRARVERSVEKWTTHEQEPEGYASNYLIRGQLEIPASLRLRLHHYLYGTMVVDFGEFKARMMLRSIVSSETDTTGDVTSIGAMEGNNPAEEIWNMSQAHTDNSQGVKV